MRLLTKEVAAMVGLRESTIRRYRTRGTFPEPDGTDFGHPWWTKETIETWLKGRRVRQTNAYDEWAEAMAPYDES